MLTAEEDPAPTSSQVEAIEVIQKLRELGHGAILDALADPKCMTKGNSRYGGGRLNTSAIARRLGVKQHADVRPLIASLRDAAAHITDADDQEMVRCTKRCKPVARKREKPRLTYDSQRLAAEGYYSLSSLADFCGVRYPTIVYHIQKGRFQRPTIKIDGQSFLVYDQKQAMQIKASLDSTKDFHRNIHKR